MHFEKITKEQWYRDYDWGDNPYSLDKLYDEIQLPKQGSEGSAGMDFFAYEDVTVQPNEVVKVPTGIRWVVPKERFPWDGTMQYPNYVLNLYPRSGSGIKGLNLMNQVGIIDPSYCDAENEGHIILFLTNRGKEPITIKKGKGIVQGIVMPYMICEGAKCKKERIGGFGSTD